MNNDEMDRRHRRQRDEHHRVELAERAGIEAHDDNAAKRDGNRDAADPADALAEKR